MAKLPADAQTSYVRRDVLSGPDTSRSTSNGYVEGLPASCRVFEDQFTSAVDTDLLCSICRGLDLNLVLSGCGNEHLFCKQCICAWLERNNTCPICQANITADGLQRPSRLIRGIVNRIEVVCSCRQWQGHFVDLPQHLRRCRNRRFPCRYRRYGCQEELTEDALGEHERVAAPHHLGLLSAALQKTEERERRYRAEIEYLRNTVDRLSDVISRVAPMESCLAFGEPLPKVYAIGHVRGSTEEPLLEYWHTDKRQWVQLSTLPQVDPSWRDFALLIHPHLQDRDSGGSPGLLLIGGRRQQDERQSSSASSSSSGLAMGMRRRRSAAGLGGGEASTNICLMYAVVSNRWLEMAPMCVARAAPAVAELKGDVYVFGGWSCSEQKPVTSLEVYKTAKNVWNVMGIPPFVGHVFCAVGYQGRIFVLAKPHDAVAFPQFLPHSPESAPAPTPPRHPFSLPRASFPFPAPPSPFANRGKEKDNGPCPPSQPTDPSHSGDKRDVPPAIPPPPPERRGSLRMLASRRQTGGGGGDEGREDMGGAGGSGSVVRCAAQCYSLDPVRGLQESGSGWQPVEMCGCQDATQLCVIEGRLYAECTAVDSDTREIGPAVQMYSVETNRFTLLSRVSTGVLAPKMATVRQCGLPLEEKLRWLATVGGERGHKRAAVWV
ncbi:unnamed protein product [Vitrella brassicaformis CCMP3155]|uniref:RING-type domain-containing protein n=3 Tax=Vitrella brassicaformis TaxID=1169539 RepID=A0A0G4EQ00_VITBC|nr:unnamed protein product [Vitrella brassicaformis CCMP3155]|eukprot:CEL99499.1 unnamed protein product [Vitrella brassicaformis CCMP3155]